MHIAHRDQQESVNVEELAKRIGLKRRQVAYLARKGEIPDVICVDGYHKAYPLTPANLGYIDWKRQKVKERKQPKTKGGGKKTTGVITIQGIRQEFDIWFRRAGRLDGILKIESEYLEDIIREIQPIARLHSRIIQELRSRDSVKET